MKSKSLYKTVDVVTNSEENGVSKGKHQHIAAITWGAPRENVPLKKTVKKKIVELKFVHNKYRNTLAKTLNRPMLGFQNNIKVRGI